MAWYRFMVTGVDADDQSTGDYFTVEADDEQEGEREARAAATDCGWEVDTVEYIGAETPAA